MIFTLILLGLIVVSIWGPKFLEKKWVNACRMTLKVILGVLLALLVITGIVYLVEKEPTILVPLIMLAVGGFAYLLIRKPKTATAIVIGLFSLITMVVLLIPMSQSLGHIKMSDAPLITLFAFMLLLCSLGLFGSFVFSVTSIVKMIGINKEKAYTLLKKVFFIAILFISISLVIVLLSTIISNYTTILFSSYGDTRDIFILAFILCASIIITWSFVGLFLLKKEQDVMPIELQTTLSNRVGLLIITYVISLGSLLPAVLMMVMSFTSGMFGGDKTLIDMLQMLGDSNPTLTLLGTVFAICSLLLTVIMLLNGVFTVLTGALKPEKAKKALHITFFATVLTSAVTILCSVIPVNILGIKISIGDMIDQTHLGPPVYFPLVIILVLGIVGYLLLRNSKIISVAELSAKKAQERENRREAKKEATQRTMESMNINIDTGKEHAKTTDVDTTHEFVKQYAPVVQQFLQKIKDILFSPKTTWQSIESENLPNTKVFTSYILPLMAIVFIAAFIGWGFIGFSVSKYSESIAVLGYDKLMGYDWHIHSAVLGLKMAFSLLILFTVGFYITTLIISLMAKNFRANESFDKTFSLVAYSCTPILLGGIFHFIPSISWLLLVVSLYSFYLFYTGLKPLMQIPEEKKMQYLIVSILSLAVVFFALGWILTKVFSVTVFGNIAW